MNIALGQSALLLALLGAVAGAVTLIVGLARGGHRCCGPAQVYIWLVVGGAVLATVAMQRALISHDFTLAYVDSNDSTFTPLIYRITAMWSDLAGSILLWALVLSGLPGRDVDPFPAPGRRTRRPVVEDRRVHHRRLLLRADAHCFRPLYPSAWGRPDAGAGPTPCSRTACWWLFTHPLLYLGLVGFTVPFCFAIAGLVTGRTDEAWLSETRRWAIFSWACLTAGVVLGAWWSYQVLGWGGYWSWDPVENSALLPWLTGTAFLHSAVVQQRRGMLRVWNLSLVLATFSLTILGTFFTRSGRARLRALLHR